MKILHWAIILVIIVLPIAIVCMINVNAKFSALKDEVRINNAIDTATQDAIDQLISLNSSVSYTGKFGDIIDITPAVAQEMIDTFFHTLAVNYNIPYQYTDLYGDNNYGYIKNYFSSYIPAIVIVAYDGFYIYSLEDYGIGYKYELSSKIPYVRDYVTEEGKKYSVGYTLGDDIYLYYNGKCYAGKLTDNSIEETQARFDEYQELYGNDGFSSLADYVYTFTNDMSSIIYALSIDPVSKVDFNDSIMPSNGVTNFLADYKYDNDTGDITQMAGPFHIARRDAIVDIVTSALSEEINDHKKYANIMGITYDFTFPTLSKQDWMNTIEDISFFAFVQGIPIGNASGSFYNNFALGGSKIVRSIGYTIALSLDGHRYYHEPTCPVLDNISDDKVEVIGVKSKKEAVTRYEAYPCLICN